MAAFIGTHSCKVDSKGRISIPASFRRFLGAEGGETFVVTRGIDRCLSLYAPDGWREFQEKMNSLPPGKRKRQVIRFFSRNSKTLLLDKQGRVGIPRDFMSDYGMDKEVLLVGALDYIEVWNPKEFETHLKEAPEALDELEHLL